MKILTGLFSLLISGNIFAANLCTTTCELNVTFPDGGSLEALEPVTITFGAGGYINDGNTVTGFSAGETIVMEALESIDFDSHGSFELGSGGNITYSSLQIDSTGELEIASAVAGSSINIEDIALLGLRDVAITGDLTIADAGALHISSGSSVATDISLTGHRSLSAIFGLESASISIGNLSYDDVTELLLIETDDAIALTATEAVIEPLSVSQPYQQTQIDAPVVVSSDNPVSAGGSGSAGLLSLLALFISLLGLRSSRSVTKR